MEFDGSKTGAAAFATTHWSIVLRAAQDTTDDQIRALETLCQDYWYPLYAYVRRLGHSPHDAQDLTQGFFAYLLEKDLLAKADPHSGRFRSFLLGSLKNFMANEWRRQNAQKRASSRTVSIDVADAEDRYAAEPADLANPQVLYDQAWAIAVMEQASALLEAEYRSANRHEIFQLLSACLQGDRHVSTYTELGTRLKLSEGGVKTAVHRMRERYRELLRAVVAQTVADPLEVESELRHLVQVLSHS